MDLYRLLSLLADGEFHSGSELGELLGVTRTSVWKSLPQLQALSVPIESLKGKGYRIPGGLDLLDKNKIISELPSEILNSIDIDILLSHSSTNDYLSQNSKLLNSNKYRACLAEVQTEGRGRRGRSWVSPFGQNISLSLGFVIQGGVESLSGLSLVIGVAVARTLDGLGVKNVGLKWPNDVYVDDKKIAGILIELSGEATTQWSVICGVGLNVLMDSDVDVKIDQAWVALKEYVDISRNMLVSELLVQLVNIVEEFKDRSFGEFIDEWSVWDVLRGKEVCVLPDGLVGKALGVNEQGALVLDVLGKKCVINAGEVSVRGV